MPKQVYVANLHEGDHVDDLFLLTSKSVASARNGSRYLRLKLADKTGEIDAFKWDPSDADIAGISEGDCVLVRGTTKTYNERLQLTLESIRRATETIDFSCFLAASPHDPNTTLSELKEILGRVENPDLRQLLASFFEDEELLGRFKQCPAAKRIHHAYIGGLLDHTLNVVRICNFLTELYPAANRDILLTTAALHDIGKTEELDWSGKVDFSLHGQMIGHVVGSAMMVKEAIEKIEGFDPTLALVVLHAILAHHGQREFGSPTEPKSLEAVLLHHADDLDAKAAIVQEAINESQRSGEPGLFTQKHFLLDRVLFRGVNVENPAEETAEAEFRGDLFVVDSDELSGEDMDQEFDPFADE